MPATKSIRGVYRAGKVELAEDAGLAEGTEVVVTVPAGSHPGPMITLGMFPGPPFTTEEEFKAAKWHGEPEIWGEDDVDTRR
jgi:hypothetical protein